MSRTPHLGVDPLPTAGREWRVEGALCPLCPPAKRPPPRATSRSSARGQELTARLLLREASLDLARLRRIHGAYRKTWRLIARAQARIAFAAALVATGAAEPAAGGAPIFQHGLILETGTYAYDTSPTLADIDGDGDLDVFVGRYAGVAIFENTGNPSTPAFSDAANPFGLEDVGYGASPTFADLDGDGDLDALVGEAYGNTSFFANTGTASAPAFATPSANPFGLMDVGAWSAPTLADLDGDGDLDALVGEDLGNTILFANTGTAATPAFAAPSTNPFGLTEVGYRATPAFADVDGDGDLDAFFGEYYVSTIVFENTGTASVPAFAAPSSNGLGLVNVGRRASPAFADIDSDGDLDAFVGEHFGGTFFFENVELGPGTCSDGLDNDLDGTIDLAADPGCANASDTDERSSRQCDNGRDDDGDGKIDWRGDGSGDPNCVSLTDNSEQALNPVGCGIGPELLLVAPLLAAGFRGRRADR